MITLSPAKDDYKEGLLLQSRTALEAMQAGCVGFSAKQVVNLGDLPSTLFPPPERRFGKRSLPAHVCLVQIVEADGGTSELVLHRHGVIAVQGLV